MTRNHLLLLRLAGAPPRAWLCSLGRYLRTLVSLFINPHTPGRARGRVPMMLAMRDFLLGRYGPAPVSR
jgi:hypothetical protein